MVKDLTSKHEEVARDRNDLVQYIQDTGATPQQYSQALGYLKLVNSPNRADREQALKVMQGEMTALSQMLGIPVPGVNVLEGHNDLIEEVGSGRLSPQRAAEIAAARNHQAYQQRVDNATQQSQQTAQQQAQMVQQGKQALNVLGQQLQQANPQEYAAKYPVLVKQLRPIFAKLHPSLWAQAYRDAYAALPMPAAAITPRPPVPPTNGTGNTPLRASNPAGGQRPAPTSLQEAIGFGIADAGR